MNESSQALNDRLRGLLAAAVVVFAFATVFMHVSPADAAETKYLPVVLRAHPGGPALPADGVAVEVPLAQIADDDLRAALDGGATIDRLTTSAPVPHQAGPHHDSTTWDWEVCVWVTWNGTTYEWCFELTIEVSTTIPNTAPAPNSYAASNTSPIKVCWEEPLPGGGWAIRCIRITIKTGNTAND